MPETLSSGKETYSLKGLVLYFLKLGTIAFGGPVALAGYMERDLVEERGWVTSEEYIKGLAFSKIAPGPFATQLALYIGYIRAKTLGATLVGIFFILPSFLMVVGFAALYVEYGEMAWISAAFYGVSAAVIGIMIRSAYKLTRTVLEKNRLLWSIFIFSAIATAWLEGEPLWLLIAAGILNLLYVTRGALFSRSSLKLYFPLYVLDVIPVATASRSFIDLFLYFIKAGSVVFGSGLAIVPFLYGEVVTQNHWLTNKQFVDAVAVSMITPGPVVITVAFIGYLISSLPGAIAAALGVFLPVYLFVTLLTPFYEKVAKNIKVKAFIFGVTAATTGAIAGSLFNLGRHSLIELPSIAIMLVTAALLFRFKIPEVLIVLAAAAIGLLIKM
ncbi:MAG: chromate transporter [Ignavibacteriota bacterium]